MMLVKMMRVKMQINDASASDGRDDAGARGSTGADDHVNDCALLMAALMVVKLWAVDVMAVI